MKRLLACVLAIGAAASWPARAQDVWGWSVLVPSYTQTDILGTALRQSTQRAQAAAPAPLTESPGPVAAAALRFTASPERRRANFAKFLAERRGSDADSLRVMETTLARPDLMPQVETELRRFGLRTDNVADAYALWWITLWQTANGRPEDPSRAATLAVKGQAERAFLAMPGIATADDAAKQAFAEGLLIQSIFLGAALDQAKQDPAQVRALAQIARRNARQTGVIVDGLVLTDQGFRAAAG
jgi:hypothetical protein